MRPSPRKERGFLESRVEVILISIIDGGFILPQRIVCLNHRPWSSFYLPASSKTLLHMARSEEEDRIPLRSTAISVSNVRIDHDLRSSWIMGMCRRLHTLLESERVYYDEAGEGSRLAFLQVMKYSWQTGTFPEAISNHLPFPFRVYFSREILS